MGASWFLALLLVAQTFRPTLRDLTFLPFFEKANPKVKHVAELKRMGVAGNQDLVVMLASPVTITSAGGAPWWSSGALVGVFLQSYAEPPTITTLAMLTDSCDCTVGVERAREDELTLVRVPEKGMTPEKIKLSIDVRQKKLVSRSSYLPFAVTEIGEQRGAPILIAGNGLKQLTIRPNADETGFTVQPERQRNTPVEGLPVAFGPDRRFRLALEANPSWGPQKIISDGKRRYPLPQSTMAEFETRRQDVIKLQGRGWRPAPENLGEEIGPHQLWGDKLWFGKTFYGGEGHVGVGGFGYFDAATGAYTIYSPPELWPWSVSALRVESDAVWLGLVHRGEYGGPSGGLLRWDRVTHEIQKYPLRSGVNAIYQSPNALYVATQDGIAVLRPGHQFFEHYIVDVTASGNYRVVPAF